MNIDFNNVRRQALAAYGDLVRTLKYHTDVKGRIAVDRCEIRSAVDDLRSAIIAIAASYQAGDPDCRCVLKESEIVPWLYLEDEVEGE